MGAECSGLLPYVPMKTRDLLHLPWTPEPHITFDDSEQSSGDAQPESILVCCIIIQKSELLAFFLNIKL